MSPDPSHSDAEVQQLNPSIDECTLEERGRKLEHMENSNGVWNWYNVPEMGNTHHKEGSRAVHPLWKVL